MYMKAVPTEVREVHYKSMSSILLVVFQLMIELIIAVD